MVEDDPETKQIILDAFDKARVQEQLTRQAVGDALRDLELPVTTGIFRRTLALDDMDAVLILDRLRSHGLKVIKVKS